MMKAPMKEYSRHEIPLTRTSSCGIDFLRNMTVENVVIDVLERPRGDNLYELTDAPYGIYLRDALDLLRSRKISSLPLYRHAKEFGTKEYVKILDTIDLVGFIAMERETHDPRCMRISEMFDLKDSEPLPIFEATTPLYRVFKYLDGKHNSLLCQCSGSTYLITARDILKFISMHEEVFNTRIMDLNIQTELSNLCRPVVVVKDSDTMLCACEKMSRECSYDIAVVDEDGCHVLTLNGQNMSILGSNDFVGLHKITVSEFLEKIQSECSNAELKNLMTEILDIQTVSGDCTLRKALRLLTKDHIRQIYCESHNKPKKSVVMADIISHFALEYGSGED